MPDVVIPLAILAAALAVALGVFVEVGLPALRDHRARTRSLRDVEARVAELDRLPPPEAVPRARDVTKAEQRSQRGRRHPIAHKRRTGGWG